MNRKKVLAFAIGPLFGAALSLVSLPLMAWYFPPEDIGRNNVFQTFTSFSILLFILGLDQAYVREFHETKNRFSLFKTCFVPGFLLLLTVFLLTIPFAGKIARLLYGVSEPRWYLVTVCCIILSFMARYLSLVVRMQERGLAYSFSQVLPKLIIIGMLIGYVIGGVDPIYINLLYANFLSILVMVILFSWNIRGDFLFFASSKIDIVELKRVLAFGTPLIGAGVAYWGLSATSTIALRTFSDYGELGIYAMAMNFAGFALIFQGIFATVWMPTVYKWIAANEDLNKIDAVVSNILTVVCFIFSFVGIFSWLVDYILPHQYGEIKYLILCCMVQPLLYTLSEATVVGLNVQRKSILALGISVVALLFNVMFSILLVPRFGAIGAAIANALAYVVFFIARTEISVKVWRPMLRVKMYFMVFVMVILSISMTLTQIREIINFTLVWVAVFPLLVMVFRKNIKNIFAWVFLLK